MKSEIFVFNNLSIYVLIISFKTLLITLSNLYLAIYAITNRKLLIGNKNKNNKTH